MNCDLPMRKLCANLSKHAPNADRNNFAFLIYFNVDYVRHKNDLYFPFLAALYHICMCQSQITVILAKPYSRPEITTETVWPYGSVRIIRMLSFWLLLDTVASFRRLNCMQNAQHQITNMFFFPYWRHQSTVSVKKHQKKCHSEIRRNVNSFLSLPNVISLPLTTSYCQIAPRACGM